MAKPLYRLATALGGLLISGQLLGATVIECNNALDFVETQPLQFGSFAIGGVGAVTLLPTGGLPVEGGLVDVVTNSAWQPGIISISLVGKGNKAPPDCSGMPITITVTTKGNLKLGGTSMTLGSWVTNPPAGTMSFPLSNALDIYIGATASAAGGEPAGNYSGSYTLDVSF